jgi:hypothetical protein
MRVTWTNGLYETVLEVWRQTDFVNRREDRAVYFRNNKLHLKASRHTTSLSE